MRSKKIIKGNFYDQYCIYIIEIINDKLIYLHLLFPADMYRLALSNHYYHPNVKIFGKSLDENWGIIKKIGSSIYVSNVKILRNETVECAKQLVDNISCILIASDSQKPKSSLKTFMCDLCVLYDIL